MSAERQAIGEGVAPKQAWRWCLGMAGIFVTVAACSPQGDGRGASATNAGGGTGAAASAVIAADAGLGPTDVETLLAHVPPNSTWESISPDIRQQLKEHADSRLRANRQQWGKEGLEAKVRSLSGSATAEMVENIDRVLSVMFSSVLPRGFSMTRDVKNYALRASLIRLYVAKTETRSDLLANHPEFRGWDGLPIREFHVFDDQTIAALAGFLADTEKSLRGIDDGGLDTTERGLREKAYFQTRQGKHFARPPAGQSGSFGFATTYTYNPEIRPFKTDSELLDAYNTSMFSKFREINRGTLESFDLDFAAEFNPAWLSSRGLSDALAQRVLTLAGLYSSRVHSLPEAQARCTIFSADDRSRNWDAFTASQLTNSDGSESFESYAAAYAKVAAQRTAAMRTLAGETVDALLPKPSKLLTEPQRADVHRRLLQADRPAAIQDAIRSALNEATGSTAASAEFDKAADAQSKIGGYKDGEALRDSDRTAVVEMWRRVQEYIKAHYSGYDVDIAALVPAAPTITTTGEMCFSIGGEVSIGLRNSWYKASLYSTVMHEIKHAIDQKSHAAVEGAAWEGAATSIEHQVWPKFIVAAMAAEPRNLPLSRLLTQVDNVRFTATTDATLKLFLRPSCQDSEPDTISFAHTVVAGYGFKDEATIALRSKRAHASTQYLEYDYGAIHYEDIVAYLQKGIGGKPEVDAYLLQACGMASPTKNQASIDKLAACVRAKK